MNKLVWISASLFLAACGDNTKANPDAAVQIDATAIDAAVDAPMSTFMTPMPYGPPISALGPDQIHSVKAGPNGSFYLAGFRAATATGDKVIFVAKTTAAGPDITFGNIPNSGIALIATAITPTGGTDEIDIALQSDGKILVSFNVVNGTTDRDVAVLRLTTAGALDPTFGGNNTGMAVIDFNAKGTTNFADNARGLAVDANDNVFVHAQSLAPGVGRTDSEFALAKLTSAGLLCDGTNGTTGWGAGDSGKFFLDTPINNVNALATPRGVIALADGSVIAGGYTNILPPGNQPVLYKLDVNGDLATAFGNGTGIVFDMILSRQTEVYNFALQNGTHVVTGGYGNVAGQLRDDWISMRFDVTTGARDLTWGGTTNGAKLIDVSAAGVSSNCRNAISLPGGKTLLIGSSGSGADQDATFVVLDAAGNLDTKYGTGIHRIKFTPADDKNDQFWGATVSGNNVMIAGWRGTATSPVVQTDTLNDNSYLVAFALQP
jgi:uncharacterized delta-60 repeat protein